MKPADYTYQGPSDENVVVTHAFLHCTITLEMRWNDYGGFLAAGEDGKLTILDEDDENFARWEVHIGTEPNKVLLYNLPRRRYIGMTHPDFHLSYNLTKNENFSIYTAVGDGHYGIACEHNPKYGQWLSYNQNRGAAELRGHETWKIKVHKPGFVTPTIFKYELVRCEPPDTAYEVETTVGSVVNQTNSRSSKTFSTTSGRYMYSNQSNIGGKAGVSVGTSFWGMEASASVEVHAEETKTSENETSTEAGNEAVSTVTSNVSLTKTEKITRKYKFKEGKTSLWQLVMIRRSVFGQEFKVKLEVFEMTDDSIPTKIPPIYQS